MLHIVYGYLGEHKAVIGVIGGEGAADICVIDTCANRPPGSEVPFYTKAHGERETGFVGLRNRVIDAFLGSGGGCGTATAQERSLGAGLEISRGGKGDIPGGIARREESF